MPGDVRLRCDEDVCRVKERISFKGGGTAKRPSGAVGRRPSIRPNRNVSKAKEPPLWTAQTAMDE